MTIYDISKKAGVSIATVSRVLNGSDKVRPSTKKKVMDIIEKYDYTPNALDVYKRQELSQPRMSFHLSRIICI